MIENKIDQAIKDSGLKESVVCQKFNDLVTGSKLTTRMLWKIKKNKQQITLHQVVFLAKVLDIKDFRDLLVRIK